MDAFELQATVPLVVCLPAGKGKEWEWMGSYSLVRVLNIVKGGKTDTTEKVSLSYYWRKIATIPSPLLA